MVFSSRQKASSSRASISQKPASLQLKKSQVEDVDVAAKQEFKLNPEFGEHLTYAISSIVH